MTKLILAMALLMSMVFVARDATAGAWCEGVLTDTDDDGSPDPGSGACTRSTAAGGGHPDPTTGCQGVTIGVSDFLGIGNGCFAAAEGGDACIGGSVSPAGIVGCLCVQGICMCSTGSPLSPAIPCDEGLCRASAELGCSS